MNERVGVSRVNAGDAAMIDGDERSDILEFWTRSEEPLSDHAITNEKYIYIYIYFISDYENRLRIDKWVKLTTRRTIRVESFMKHLENCH